MDFKIIGVASVATLIAGVIGYSVYNSKKSNKPPAKPFDRDLLIRILEELKYQIFSLCLEKADKFKEVNESSKKHNLGQSEIQNQAQRLCLDIYKKKEDYILGKYAISKEEFETALNKTYANDKDVQEYNTAIEDMLLSMSNGNIPSLQVPAQVKQTLTIERTFQLHKQLQKLLFNTLVKGYRKELEENKNFSLANRQDVIHLVRKINLFKKKVQFIAENVPQLRDLDYSTFLKLTEKYKMQSPLFAAKLQQLDDLYSEFFNPDRKEIDLDYFDKQFEAVSLNQKQNINKMEPIKSSKQADDKPVQDKKSQEKIEEKIEHKIENKAQEKVQQKQQQKILEKIEQKVVPVQSSVQVVSNQKEKGANHQNIEERPVEKSTEVEFESVIIQEEKPKIEATVDKQIVNIQQVPDEQLTLPIVETAPLVESQPIVEPVVKHNIQPVSEPNVEQIKQSGAQHVQNLDIQPAVEPSPVPIVQPVVEPVVISVIEPVAQSIVQSVNESVAEQIKEQGIQNSLKEDPEQIQKSINQSINEIKIQPTHQLKIEKTQQKEQPTVQIPHQQVSKIKTFGSQKPTVQQEKPEIKQPAQVHQQQPKQQKIEPEQIASNPSLVTTVKNQQEKEVNKSDIQHSQVSETTTTSTILAQTAPHHEQTQKVQTRIETEESIPTQGNEPKHEGEKEEDAEEDEGKRKKGKKNKNKNKHR